MTVEDDYKEVLDGNVDEVKSRIREEDDLDYELLLELEEAGDDRKTVKTFIESRIVEGEDLAEQIEETTEGSEGFLSRLDSGQVLAGGVLVGLLIGLVAGALSPVSLSSSSMGKSQAEISDTVETMIASGGLNGTVEVSDFEERSGMYYMNITVNQETPNGTVSQSQGAYATTDGKLLFPVRKVLGQQVSPINLEERVGNATR